MLKALPLAAAIRSLDWVTVQCIFIANMPAIQEQDSITGLPAFMLAAIGVSSNLESIYNLLRQYPPAMVVQQKITPTILLA